MSLTTEILKRIDAAPIEFNLNDVRGNGSRSGVGSAIDRMVTRKILARTGKGDYRRLVPSATQAYLKSLNRQSASMKEATQKADKTLARQQVREIRRLAGRPTGDNTNTSRVLEAMQNLETHFGFQDLQDAVRDIPKSSVVYSLNKCKQYNLVEQRGRGEYLKLVPDVIDGYYRKRGHPPAKKLAAQGKEQVETVAGPAVGMRRPDGLFLIMIGNRQFLSDEVAITKRGKGE